MTEGTTGFLDSIISVYNAFLNSLPSWTQNFINLFLLVILVVGFCIIIWKFYTIISKKDILKLNLGKYNNTDYPFWKKVMAGFLYFLEYIIIIPFIIFFWFTFFTLFLILMTEIEIGTVLIISAICISAIRMTSYYKQELSKELAIMLTLDLLVFAILTKGVFSFERIIENFSQIPAFVNNIFVYFLFIVLIEIFLRFFDFIFSLFGLQEEDER